MANYSYYKCLLVCLFVDNFFMKLLCIIYFKERCSLLAIFLLVLTTIKTGKAQNVGIGTATPQSKLDINGDGAFRFTDITIACTYNYDVNVNAVI